MPLLGRQCAVTKFSVVELYVIIIKEIMNFININAMK